MQTMNISLPDPMKQYVEEQVNTGGYSSASEYVRKLIPEDEKRTAEEKLKGLLLAGLNSGDPIEIAPEYWQRKRQQLVELYRKSAR